MNYVYIIIIQIIKPFFEITRSTQATTSFVYTKLRYYIKSTLTDYTNPLETGSTLWCSRIIEPAEDLSNITKLRVALRNHLIKI